jgi:DNA-directed RNA polymerase subunit alpha
MDRILPKIECEASSQNYGKFVIGPLESGFGITLGNALRRTLLSSLTGAAVTSLRVSGVHHEFSDIPHVREDMTTFILNVKQLRLIMHDDGPARLHLSVSGEGDITAGDLEVPGQVDIINPDLHLLSSDSADADLDIEFVVEKGRGYSPAEDRAKLPIGDIPVDAIFSPVRRTNYVVEPARVGQMTDFDRLVLEISTDGSIAPQDALRQSAQILVRHFNLVATFGETPVETEEAPHEGGIPSRVYETPIEDLGLTVRAYNCLKRAGVTKVGEVLERLEKGEEEILAVRNFGRKSLDELREKLIAKGFLSPVAAAASAGSSVSAADEDESVDDLDTDDSELDDLDVLDEADSDEEADWDEDAEEEDVAQGEEDLEDLETE